MEKKSYNGLDLNVYEEVLDNGLRIFISPIPRHTIHARITTFFGGSVLEFKMDESKDFIKVPGGIAHFLEHKMFEKEDGVDPLSIYENNGASGNAFTNEFVTAYHFTGAGHFYENLETLLKCVHEPYFTDENVLKEKGIISQEKKQDLDNPFSIVYDRSLVNTFHNLDFKNTVLGSLEDINSITKEDLYNCYNTFYHPSNMILTVSGDVDSDEVIKFIKDFYKKYDFKKRPKVEIKHKDEPESVVKDKDIIYMDNLSKEILISYKVKKPNYIKDVYLNKIYFSFLLDMKFGAISQVVDVFAKNKNLISSVSSYLEVVDDYYVILFNATVKDGEDEIIDLIDKTIKDFDFNEEDFNLIKKAVLNSTVLSTENSTGICNMISNQVYFYGKPIYDMYDKLKKLDFETFKKSIQNINLNNRSVVVLDNKNSRS
ncbi:insulysin peptidase family M16 (Insulinase) [Firmicutes bacterium CAG:822]|nr:insulysin peptidase family M16 (Insulinase) [Firmicutes bacterium CAG:822]